jgi:hypothetical protein
MSACNAATGEYSKADADLATVLRNTKSMQGVTPDQVTDAKTVTTLRDAVSKANSISVAAGCPASLSADALQDNAKDAKRLAAALRSSTDDITTAAKAVTTSKAAKDAANAAAIQTNLKTATADAQTLLNNSLYSVADNSTRVALENAIKTANTLLGQNKPDAAAMQNALTGLQTASDAVKSSMNDLVVQNQIAAQQQAQLQAQQQAQQNQQQTPAQPVVPAPSTDNGTGSTGNQNSGDGSGTGNQTDGSTGAGTSGGKTGTDGANSSTGSNGSPSSTGTSTGN